jgi:glycosyltransferase involved in cell wall biosynthesis
MVNGCVLIPAYNEQVHIGDVIQSSKKFLPVIVVDDGSQDETVRIAEQNGARVFKQVPNQGKGAALRRGFQEAMSQGYEFVITLDADGQHAPHEILAFLSEWKKAKTDLIIGYRNFSQMPFIRKFSNSTGTYLFSRAVGRKILDNQSGYRLISQPLMNLLLDSKEQGFEFEVEMIVTCIKNELKLGWVPISTIYGDEKSHIQPVKHVVNFLRVVRQARKSLKIN